MPDKMKDMIDQKISHLKVQIAHGYHLPLQPLHAMHYYKLNIFEKHKNYENKINYIDNLLTIPIVDRPN